MIYEHRTYRLRVGALPSYIKLIGEEAIEVQKRHLGNLVGYFHTEFGPLNQVIHIWAYEDYAERDRRRAALMKDPAWQAVLPKILALIEDMESKILKPMPFSPGAGRTGG